MKLWILFRPVTQSGAQLFSERACRHTMRTLCCALSHSHVVALMLLPWSCRALDQYFAIRMLLFICEVLLWSIQTRCLGAWKKWREDTLKWCSRWRGTFQITAQERDKCDVFSVCMHVCANPTQTLIVWVEVECTENMIWLLKPDEHWGEPWNSPKGRWERRFAVSN